MPHVCHGLAHASAPERDAHVAKVCHKGEQHVHRHSEETGQGYRVMRNNDNNDKAMRNKHFTFFLFLFILSCSALGDIFEIWVL